MRAALVFVILVAGGCRDDAIEGRRAVPEPAKVPARVEPAKVEPTKAPAPAPVAIDGGTRPVDPAARRAALRSDPALGKRAKEARERRRMERLLQKEPAVGLEG